jgi:hypothetical protein
MNINVRSVIPTGVRASACGWSNGAEEPAVLLAQATGFRKNLFRAVVASILLACNGIAAGQGTAASDAQKQLSNITAALANNTVASIDILHMPDEVETRASVTPENLERWFDFRITINKAREWAGRDGLVKTLRSTTVSPGPRMPDLRSAIVFNGTDGKRIGTLYVGRYFGKYLVQFDSPDGAVEKIPVKFNSELTKWLKEMIPSPLR